MAATGGTGGLGALPLAGIGAAVVVVGGAVMAWLGVFDSDDMRRIVDRASSEESTVVISPSATNPVITEGLSLQPDPVASDPADSRATSDAVSDQLAEQAGDVAVTQSQPQGETQDDQPSAPVATPQVAEPGAQAAASLPGENTAAAEVNADTSAAVIATPEAKVPGVSPSPAVVPVSPAETVGKDQQVAAADPTAAPATGDLAQLKTDDTNASVEPADTQTAQAQDALQDAQGLEAPVVAEASVAEPAVTKSAPETPVVEGPVLEAPRLDLVRIDPTGQAVIAGRAAQGVQVSILLDGEVLEKVEVQSGGDFVSLTSIRPSATARVISLRAEADGQQRLSETSFILAPASAVPATASTETADQPATLLVDDQVIEEAATTEVAIAGATRQEMSREEMTGADNIVSSEVSTKAGVAVAGDTADDAATADTSLSPVADTAEGGAASRATASAVDGGQIASGAEEISDAQSDGAAVTSISPADVTTQAPQAAAPSDVVSDPDTNLRTAETTALSQPDATSAGTPEAQADAELQPAPRPEATQVAVLRADADGVVLVQPVAQKPQGKVVLDTISYSDSGEVQLAGRARADARVLVYLDNASAGQFVAGSNGSWSGGLEAVVPGVYTLRLDEVNADGKVLSRLETPFKREAPEVLRPPVTDEAGQGAATPLVRAVTVQKGDTLWAISQQRYGSGFLYVRVFAANQDAIRNPDLIYPGQVFAIPE